MPRITLDKMITGYRAAIVRAEKRAEVLTISAEQLSHFLDLLEERLALDKDKIETLRDDVTHWRGVKGVATDWSPR
jgi:hypothetical protein